MSERNLLVLAIVAAALIIAAALFYSGLDFSRESFRSGTPLLQGLAPEKIGAIEIKKGTDSLTLKCSGDGFVIEEKDGYPADTTKINDLIIHLMEIRLAEKVTEAPANHEELGVATKSPDAVSVILLDSDGKKIVGLIKGKAAPRGSGAYVRKEGEDAVYSTESNLNIESEPVNYIETDLFDLKAEDISRVDVTTPEGGYALVKEAGEGDEEGEVHLLNPPRGKKVAQDTLDDVFEALEYLSLDDVMQAGKVQLEWDTTYRCALKNGLIYVVQLAKLDGKYYARLAAQPPEVDSVSISADEGDESLKEKEAILLAGDKAEEFSSKHRGWVYEIPESDAEDMSKPLADLFEKEEGEG
jgi:hypothetical protein